jgi:hypothetical protein
MGEPGHLPALTRQLTSSAGSECARADERALPLDSTMDLSAAIETRIVSNNRERGFLIMLLSVGRLSFMGIDFSLGAS